MATKEIHTNWMSRVRPKVYAGAALCFAMFLMLIYVPRQCLSVHSRLYFIMRTVGNCGCKACVFPSEISIADSRFRGACTRGRGGGSDMCGCAGLGPVGRGASRLRSSYTTRTSAAEKIPSTKTLRCQMGAILVPNPGHSPVSLGCAH
jgi:hypothetical protein